MTQVVRSMKFLFVALIVASLALAAACGGDDNTPGEPDPVADPSAGADPEPDPEPDPEADPVAGQGVVKPRADDATQVEVGLREWAVQPAVSSVAAGKIYFLVENTGPVDPHEFVIIRTDDDPALLPTQGGRVPEDEVDLIDEIEPFAANSSASIQLELEPGNYAFICNIAEVEEGELESHYELGMHAAFTVE